MHQQARGQGLSTRCRIRRRNAGITAWLREQVLPELNIPTPDLPPGYLSGLFQVQRCLETYLRAALIAQDIPSRKCRDLLILSNGAFGGIYQRFREALAPGPA